MPSIRWIRNILVEGTPCTIEILMGASHISDKCAVRIDNQPEVYFVPYDDSRDGVVEAGIEILKQAFVGRTLTHPDGQAFRWE